MQESRKIQVIKRIEKINYMTFWKEQNYGTVKRSMFTCRRREGRMNKWKRYFRAIEKLSVLIL